MSTVIVRYGQAVSDNHIELPVSEPYDASPDDQTPLGRRITLSEIAQHAGVSLKTASRAVNGEVNVAEATRDRVLEAAAELGFELNRAASMLARGVATNAVGLITGDLANPFYSALAKGVERRLRTVGWELVVASSDEDPEQERRLVDSLLLRQVSALVLVSTNQHHRYLAAVQRRGVPVVFVDRRGVGIDADAVVIDNRAGARAGVEHLIEQGYRRIAFLGDLAPLETHRQRLAGFRDGISASVAEVEAVIREDAHDVSQAERLTRALMAEDRRPDALFASNNRITIGVLHALQDEHPRPAVLGFDDFEAADLLDVSVLRHDPVGMGVAAADLAVRQGRRHADTTEIVMPVTLVARGSTRPRMSTPRPGETSSQQ